jgi:hypothetical protein
MLRLEPDLRSAGHPAGGSGLPQDAVRDEYRVLTFFPEKQAQGLETMLQEAANEGFVWVDMISRDRLIYIVMRRERKMSAEHPPVGAGLAHATPKVAVTVAHASR